MQAMSYSEYGDNSVLAYGELPKPAVGPSDVLVRVKTAGVNPVDWKVMAGGLDAVLKPSFPVVPGWDVAGVVEEVGDEVSNVHVGDEVVAYARKKVLSGGTFAEYVTLPESFLAPKPKNLSWDEAGGLPLAGLMAYQLLTQLGVGPADTVLIHAAAGGVGSMAVQIAKALGATVIGTASARNHDYVRGLGADQVVEYGDGLVERVREVAPHGVNVSADFIGGVEDETLQVLAQGGRHASIADRSVVEHGGQYVSVQPSGDDLTKLGGLVEAGQVRVEVTDTFPLAQLPDAFERSREGHVRGKLVVRVAE